MSTEPTRDLMQELLDSLRTNLARASGAATHADVTAIVLPADPDKPVRTITITWDQATYDDATDPTDSDVFIDEALRNIDHQRRWQLDTCSGPFGTRLWWVPQSIWGYPRPPVNARAEWVLGESGVDTVRSDLIVTGPGSETGWPESVPAAVAALIEAGAS